MYIHKVVPRTKNIYVRVDTVVRRFPYLAGGASAALVGIEIMSIFSRNQALAMSVRQEQGAPVGRTSGKK